jgi:CRISPR-associated exonuclease Cas4
MPVIILILIMAGLIVLRIANRQHALTGLPPGKVIYLDTSQLIRQQNAFFDPVTGLTGKPDYLLRENQAIIPVEFKSGRAPLQPYPGHIYQLAAYCYLVGEVFGERPKYGIVKYADKSFSIDFDTRLENDLLDILAEIRRCEQQIPERSHNSARRCRACGHQEICDQVLEYD